jgi:hypothetical protein
MGISELVVMVCDPQILTLLEVLLACAHWPIFGYGNGTGPPGLGVLQTSVGPVVAQVPPPLVDAGNMVFSFFPGSLNPA